MKPVIVMLVAAGCFFLTACSSKLTQSLVSTVQPASTSPSTINTTGLETSKRVVPVTTPAGEAVPYEIVAEGDPAVGAGQNSLAAAWRPGGEAPAALAAFPEEAQAALGQLETPDGSDLYLAIYGGQQPSSRYEVKIISMDKRDGQLQVTYQIAGPPPGQGAAAVMTHPYVIARIHDTALQPTEVIFVEQKLTR